MNARFDKSRNLKRAFIRESVLLLVLASSMAANLARAAETSWQSAIAAMPLSTPTSELNRTNAARILLGSFQSNHVVKALVLQPGATDEFYFFKRATASLTAPAPTLLDAVTALTNQTRIRATFRPPFLLLHTVEDPTKPLVVVKDAGLVEQLKRTPFVPHALYNDRDWDHVQPILTRTLGVKFYPPTQSMESWHFFRHAMAGWNLSGWEALEAVSLAGKTKCTVRRSKVFRRPYIVFDGDVRAPHKSKPR
jgi:hypothetical protein